MGGEAEVPDTAAALLFGQIVEYPIFRVQIGFNVHLADIVKKVKIEVVDPAFFELPFEDRLHLVHIRKVIARELGCKMPALTRITSQ